MPAYLYHCSSCGESHDAYIPLNDHPCPHCDQRARRVWQLQFAPVMQSTYIPAHGGEVSDLKKYADDLRKKGDLLSERTNIPHSFVPTSHEEAKRSVTTEGLDTTYDRMKSEGREDSAFKPFTDLGM
jgi:putative FmdB family regulatory protein